VEQHPADSRRASCAQGRGAQAELRSSLKTTPLYDHLPVSKRLSDSKQPLVPPPLGGEAFSSGNVPLLGHEVAQHAPALDW